MLDSKIPASVSNYDYGQWQLFMRADLWRKKKENISAKDNTHSTMERDCQYITWLKIIKTEKHEFGFVWAYKLNSASVKEVIRGAQCLRKTSEIIQKRPKLG